MDHTDVSDSMESSLDNMGLPLQTVSGAIEQGSALCNDDLESTEPQY